jgi:protein TonB
MPAAERDASPHPRVESASPSPSPALTSGLAPRTVQDEGDVSERPRLLGQSTLQYPALALRRGLEADVVLSLIVEPTGRVSEARVLRARGYGFDAAALAAAKELRFAPGRQRGAAVRVRVKWTCRFRLRARVARAWRRSEDDGAA